MAYVCSRCETVYADAPDDGCQGSEVCVRGPKQSLAWLPNTSAAAAERQLEAGTLWSEEHR